MSPKRIGRPPTGPTKTKKSVTIDNDLLESAELHVRQKKASSLSSLVEDALEKYLASFDNLTNHTATADLADDAKVLPIRPAPHILAAAGSPIGAEVMDWDGNDDTILVKINGLSMVPLLNDGDVVPMKHKRASRNPFMKKGLVYLVEYDGGYTVKRYETRKATAAEMAEDWAEGGKVKILESMNPAFPEIIIKQEIEWVAWLNETNPK